MLSLFLCLVALQTSPATKPTIPPPLVGLGLKVSDPPPAEVAHGEPITEWPEDKAVMLVFFSPFSPPSLTVLQTMEEQNKKNPGIELIGIAPDAPERIQTAINTVTEDSSTFPTLIADQTGRWKKAFLTPTGRTRLPVALIIGRDRTLLWHGPAKPSYYAQPFAMVSARIWDTARYTANIERTFLRGKNTNRINAARQAATTNGNHQYVLEIFDQAIQSDPANPVLQADRFEYLIEEMNMPEQGYMYADEVASRFAMDYITLNDLAWRIVSRESIQTRDLEKAQSFSDRANAIRAYRDYALLDTLARIYWMKGDLPRAIRWQRKAVALAPDSWHGDSTRHNLMVYESGNLTPGTLPSRWVSPRSNW